MSFSRFWNSSIWRLIRPTQIVQSIVSAVRIATHRLSSVSQLTEQQPTIAYGKQYVTIAIPLSHITKAEVSEHGDYVYKVTGIPAGAVLIGKSADGDAALRYAQFIETDDGYIFNKYPGNYGTISTRGGEHCTFLVCIGKPVHVGDQDYAKEYSCALDDATVAALSTEFVKLPALNGLSGDILTLACGHTPIRQNSSISMQWSEGSDLFATVSDSLYISRGCAGERAPSPVLPGASLVPMTADFCVLDIPKQRKAIWLDSEVTELPNYVKEFQDAFRYVRSFDDIVTLIKSIGQYTYNTTNSPNDPGTQKLLRKYKTVAPYVHLTQRVTVSTNVDLSGVHKLAIICHKSRNNPIARVAEESALSYLLRSARGGCVAIVPEFLTTANSIYGVTTYAEYLTSPLAAGQYIQSIVLIGTGEDGNTGVILDEIRVKPTVVRSGESIAIKITAAEG